MVIITIVYPRTNSNSYMSVVTAGGRDSMKYIVREMTKFRISWNYEISHFAHFVIREMAILQNAKIAVILQEKDGEVS